MLKTSILGTKRNTAMFNFFREKSKVIQKCVKKVYSNYTTMSIDQKTTPTLPWSKGNVSSGLPLKSNSARIVLP